MANKRRICPKCNGETRTQGPFCPNCRAELSPNDNSLDNTPKTPEEISLLRDIELNTRRKPRQSKPKPTTPEPTPNKEETKMETKTNNRGLIWVVVIIIIALLLGWWILSNRNALIAWENKSFAEQRDQLTERINALESSKIQVVVAPPPTSGYVTATNDDHYITVFKGNTDRETIDFNNAWPTYKPNDTIDWSDNSFHMDGGTWIIQYDGIISGDVDVNHIEGEPHTYDNDEHTFQVVQVKKGDRVDVTSPWMAWYTSHYSKELIVASVQTQFPTWTRQYSKLN